jgi:MFS family permease
MHHAAGCALTLRSIDGSFMSETKSIPVNASPSAKRSFAAMRHPGFRAQFITFVLAMMADNIEHVISYWMLYQKFHSPALAGFAIVSHWLPFLLFSVASGALADRFDPRRIIQIGMALFIIASLSWSYFFVTGTLQMWQAMVILVIHGCAGVLWQTPNQMLLYDIVGPSDLESAVRLNAMARYLAVLAGPAVGAAILLAFGAAPGIMLNTLFYLPLVLWLVNAPMARAPAKVSPRLAVPRGRVIGLFNMSSLGLRAFSGISVGLLGSLIGVHWSLALSALVTLAIAGGLLALP